MSAVACLKWSSHPGEPFDERFAGASLADRAALELALQHAERVGGTVTALTLGPPAAEQVLRDAAAAGAHRLVRIEAPTSMPSSDVAAALARVAGDAEWVWCGDYSLDRGSGSVPAFLAAALGARQALGVVSIEADGDHLRAVRRLDGGRREVLRVAGPAVVSVEGAVASLRRASLAAVRGSLTAPIEVVPWQGSPVLAQGVVRPFRPRARVVAPPDGVWAVDRLRALTDAADGTGARGETLVLTPSAAAARIVEALAEWGHLPRGV